MPANPRPTLTVLAGVNGAGKSSVGGQTLRALGAAYFNPDEHARLLRAKQPSLSQAEANSISWNYGKSKLEEAIANGTDFTFESTLGGKTITNLLILAAQKSHQLEILVRRLGYCGTTSQTRGATNCQGWSSDPRGGYPQALDWQPREYYPPDSFRDYTSGFRQLRRSHGQRHSGASFIALD